MAIPMDYLPALDQRNTNRDLFLGITVQHHPDRNRSCHSRTAASREPKLARVLSYTMEGWPDSATPQLQPYFTSRHELSVEAGCLMWGMKVIVSTKLQNRVLAELHTSHPGIVKMKLLARTHVCMVARD